MDKNHKHIIHRHVRDLHQVIKDKLLYTSKITLIPVQLVSYFSVISNANVLSKKQTH